MKAWPVIRLSHHAAVIIAHLDAMAQRIESPNRVTPAISAVGNAPVEQP